MVEKIDLQRLPSHIAIIMDGNGRWAKQKGMQRIFGHQNAIKAVRDSVEGCAELGVRYLTLYAFSVENWNRPALEVDGLMRLLSESMKNELPTLQKNNIRLNAIGDLDRLPASNKKGLLETMELTQDNDRMTLTLALSYSGRWDIVNATKKIAALVKEGQMSVDEIDEASLAQYLDTAPMPDPELLIRTSGEERISNFMLWQLAYSEFYFTHKFWPDFRKEDLYEAIVKYQSRERRFGMTSEQITK